MKFAYIIPKLLILDDGWQTTNSDFDGRGEWKLSDFCANEKFGHSLSEITRKAKDEFGVEKFFVWHAVMGYWGGVDVDAPKMQKYLPRLSEAVHPEGIKIANSERWNSENFPFGIVDKEKAYELLQTGGSIYIVNTVSINEEMTITDTQYKEENMIY